MYKPIRQIHTPDDDVRIWRYMDLSKFLQFVHSGYLCFCPLDKLDDKFEGYPPASFAFALQAILGNTTFPAELALRFFNSLNSRAVVSCWHQNDNESVAMWKLYTAGNDGVAIRSTVGRLKNTLRNFPEDVFIGEVRYVDHFKTDDDEDISAFTPLFRKRQSYKHERELRAIIPLVQSRLPISDAIEAIKTTPVDKVQEVLIPVNLSTLIESIILSPQYPCWARDSVQEIVTNASLAIRVEYSDCLKRTEPLESYVS